MDTIAALTLTARHLAQALERRQFVLHHQPIVDLRRGGVVGAEALLRWQHPMLGLSARKSKSATSSSRSSTPRGTRPTASASW